MSKYDDAVMDALIDRLNRIEYKIDKLYAQAQEIVARGDELNTTLTNTGTIFVDADLPTVPFFTEEEWPEFLMEEGADNFTTTVAIGDIELNADEMLHVNWDILSEDDE